MPTTTAAPNKPAEIIQKEDDAGTVEGPPPIIPPSPFIGEGGAFATKKYTPAAMSMRMQLSAIIRTTI